MPRQARLDAPGVIHHIMIRGIERRKIFDDDKDRENFIKRLDQLLSETQTSCYGWALMSNHAHFLFRSGHAGISTLMRRLLTGYVVNFNHRHNRQGQLFQNRYKSIICQEEIYLKELVRYIHLNPIRGKIVADIKDLKSYPYCGHSTLMGKIKRKWQDTKYVLGYFGGSVRAARRSYLSYVEAGISQGHRDDLVGGGLIRSLGGWAEIKKMRLKGNLRLKGDERILGNGDFVMNMLSKANEKYTRQYELKRLGYDLEKIADRAGEIYGMGGKYILSKGKQKRRVEARNLVCYWAVRELGISLTEIAKVVGIYPSAVSYAIEKGEKIVTENNYEIIN